MSKLFAKLAKLQSELKSIPETGKNTHFNYKYSTAEDIIGTVRPLCAENGLAINLSCTSHEILKDGRAASVIMTLTLTDSESGESTICTMPGYAEDSKSDKALYKAITGASKYCIRNFFCLATGDDPEKDDAPKPDLMALTATEIKRLGWGKEKCQMYLTEKFGGKSVRAQLTQSELQQFLNEIKAMPTPLLQDTRA